MRMVSAGGAHQALYDQGVPNRAQSGHAPISMYRKFTYFDYDLYIMYALFDLLKFHFPLGLQYTVRLRRNFFKLSRKVSYFVAIGFLIARGRFYRLCSNSELT